MGILYVNGYDFLSLQWVYNIFVLGIGFIYFKIKKKLGYRTLGLFKGHIALSFECNCVKLSGRLDPIVT